MVFKRFFGRGPDAPPSDAPPAAPDVEIADAHAPHDTGHPEHAPEESWATRAERVIADGASTGSKRPVALYGTEHPDAPTHFVSAAGCHVVAADGETYVDCSMGLGAVALGYAESNVTREVARAISEGTVCGLSPVLEVEIAERLCAVIPCAEQVRFLKSGAEAVSAAVRIARAYTGRDVVVACGYFGWHDWASDSAGVPAGVTHDVVRVPFDDVGALEGAVTAAGDRLAAIVLEPVVERMPGDAWIARARALCTERGAALIFDEMKTGFRLATGGFQQLSGVTPDLATFGKALANGFPLSVVCGRKDLMAVAARTWISSTLASETSALAAAGAVLAWHEQAEVCEAIAKNGAEMRRVVNAAIEASGIEGVRVEGIDAMWLLRFAETNTESEFLQRAARKGVLFKRGAYNYPALAHDEEAIQAIEEAASASFVEVIEGV
jgi:glutamate-1-semialdehyde 2,1-aminomutase